MSTTSIGPSAAPAPTPAVATALPTRALVLLAMAAFSATANLRVSDALLPQVATEFGTTVGGAAIIVTTFSLAFGCCQAFYGPLGDRLGKYRVVMAVCLLSALGTGLCAFMPTLEALAAGRLLSGVVSAAIVPLAMAWVGDVVPYEQRQGVLARFLTGQILGMAFGQIAGGVIGDLVGWRWVYVVLGGVHLLGGLGLAWEIWRNPSLHARPVVAPDAASRSVWQQFGSVLKLRWARIVLAAIFLEGMAMFGAFAYVGAHIHQRFGLGFTAVGGLLALYGVGGISYAWSAKAMVARWGERGLVGGGAIVVAVAYVGVALAPTAWLAGLGVMVMGFGFFMMHNTLQTHGTQVAPRSRGVAMSLFASCFFLGQSLGVAAAALLVDAHGTTAVLLLAAPLLLAIGFWFRRMLARR